jgi:pimeloyl-ACP methyl ester carboxylesterase
LSAGSLVRILDRVGHFPQLEAPAVVSAAVLGFLQAGRPPISV